MARCPHLGLEEHGTSPFPFPSPSHHCYLTMPELPVGQREQKRYCLSKRYQDCPLFLSQYARDVLAATVGPEAAVESPLAEPTEAMVGIAGHTGAPEEPAEVGVAQTAPEPRVEPASREEVKRSTPQEMPTHEPPAAREGVRLADAAAWPETGARRVRSPASKALLWTASGGALLVFVCVIGLVLVGAASSFLRIDTASPQLMSSAPSLLLAVSLASFGGAILLLGLLLWALRQGPR